MASSAATAWMVWRYAGESPSGLRLLAKADQGDASEPSEPDPEQGESLDSATAVIWPRISPEANWLLWKLM
jgi:hypothetical protein